MASLSTNIDVGVTIDRVYRYLRGRFDSDAYRAACEATLGYLPGVRCIEAAENKRLRFAVAGRDAHIGFRIPGWSWSYDLSSGPDGKTRVTIQYQWGLAASVVSAWTARSQASKAIIDTAMALDALAFNGA
ncbi:MAG: hypothetical protein WD468_07375 [Pirellulales bacterium]